MYYAADRLKAARALTELRSARLDDRDIAVALLQRLRNEMASDRQGDYPRVEAWLAVRRLYEATKAGPHVDLKPLWQDAIAKTAAWNESMR
jgi:hypothetical protein